MQDNGIDVNLVKPDIVKLQNEQKQKDCQKEKFQTYKMANKDEVTRFLSRLKYGALQLKPE